MSRKAEIWIPKNNYVVYYIKENQPIITHVERSQKVAENKVKNDKYKSYRKLKWKKVEKRTKLDELIFD